MLKSFNSKHIVLGIIVLILLLAVIYPTIFDKRKDIFATTKWAADSVALLAGYISFMIGMGLTSSSGGNLKKGLTMFGLGMIIMGTSFFFGPIINHYKLINGDLVEAIHGIGMLGGMIGYVLALYWFLRVATQNIPNGRDMLIYSVMGIAFMLLFIPTMSADRTLGNNVKYWTELAGFGIGGFMVTMVLRSMKVLGGKLKKTLLWLMLSVFIMSLSYIFGPISQPNSLWTGAQGGTVHHSVMAIAEFVFLITSILFMKLNVYGQENPPVFSNNLNANKPTF